MAPKSQAQTAEIADGLLLTCMDPERFDIIAPIKMTDWPVTVSR
jgi:hypothetical protein